MSSDFTGAIGRLAARREQRGHGLEAVGAAERAKPRADALFSRSIMHSAVALLVLDPRAAAFREKNAPGTGCSRSATLG